MKQQLDLRVISCKKIGTRAAHLILTNNQPLPDMQPGQFVQVQAPTETPMLRRPISIHHVDKTDNTLHLLVQIVGKGTEAITSVNPGDTLNVVLPLGNGFLIPENKDILLVGGGIGIAPLYYLALQLIKVGSRPVFLLGARSASDLIRLDAYQQVADTFITTEDASLGEKGFVTNHSILSQKHFDMVMVCGPTPMMKAVSKWANENSTPCLVSLENLMACGLGACLCCVQKTKEGHNICVCKEGPVLNPEILGW